MIDESKISLWFGPYEAPTMEARFDRKDSNWQVYQCRTDRYGMVAISESRQDPDVRDLSHLMDSTGCATIPVDVESLRTFLAAQPLPPSVCPKCYGKGEIPCRDCSGTGVGKCSCYDCGDEHDTDCNTCEGTCNEDCECQSRMRAYVRIHDLVFNLDFLIGMIGCVIKDAPCQAYLIPEHPRLVISGMSEGRQVHIILCAVIDGPQYKTIPTWQITSTGEIR